MSATRLIATIDRFALSFMNSLILIGLPVVAASLLAQSF